MIDVVVVAEAEVGLGLKVAEARPPALAAWGALPVLLGKTPSQFSSKLTTLEDPSSTFSLLLMLLGVLRLLVDLVSLLLMLLGVLRLLMDMDVPLVIGVAMAMIAASGEASSELG